MQNNIQNNRPSWKERVRKLDHIENEMPDDSLIWERLEKLIGRQPKKKIRGGWLVAASVIALLFLPASLKELKQQALNSAVSKTGLPVNNLVKPVTVPPVNRLNTTVSKKEKGSFIVRNRKAERLPEPVALKEKTDPNQFAIDNSAIAVNREIPGAIFKAQKNIAAEKKTLRVIHANELAGESGSTLDMIPYRKFIRRPAATARKDNLKPDHTIVNF